MRSLAFTALLLATASVSNAASIFASSFPAEGGVLETFVLSIQLEPGETFRGFDATFSGAVSNENPFSVVISTVFNDNNALFANDDSVDLSRDSQFLFASGDILSIGAEEGDGLLKGAISGIQNLGISENVIPFVQIATDDPCGVAIDLAIDVGDAEPYIPDFPTLGHFYAISDPCPKPYPEPSTALLTGLTLVAAAMRRC